MPATTAERFNEACNRYENVWLPACGGTETAFTARNGMRLLYCFNPRLQQHSYLDLGTDMILTPDEAREAMDY